MTVIVALDGPDGAGKSTQVRGLTSWARGLGLSARTVDKWQLLEKGVVPEARFLRGTRQEELRVCIAEMPSPSRMAFLAWMNTMAAELARRADEDLVVLDGYWVKHAAAELVAGCHESLIAAVTDSIAPVDVIVYVDVMPEEALLRKNGDLAPYECGRDPECRPERFLAHQVAVREVMLGWARTYDWCVVGSGTPEATQQQLRERIRPRLPAARRDRS